MPRLWASASNRLRFLPAATARARSFSLPTTASPTTSYATPTTPPTTTSPRKTGVSASAATRPTTTSHPRECRCRPRTTTIPGLPSTSASWTIRCTTRRGARTRDRARLLPRLSTSPLKTRAGSRSTAVTKPGPSPLTGESTTSATSRTPQTTVFGTRCSPLALTTKPAAASTSISRDSMMTLLILTESGLPASLASSRLRRFFQHPLLCVLHYARHPLVGLYPTRAYAHPAFDTTASTTTCRHNLLLRQSDDCRAAQS